MKKLILQKIKRGFLALAMCGLTTAANAQLTPGDIAVVGFNAETADGTYTSFKFSIVLLKDISAADGSIFITDKGWIAGAFSTNTVADGVLKWTPNSNYSAGTVITVTVNGTSGGFSSSNSNFTAQSAIVSGWSNATVSSGGGDQVLIFQGSEATPTFIYGFTNTAAVSVHPVAGTWAASGVANAATNSELPVGLINGSTAIANTKDPAVGSSNAARNATNGWHTDNLVYKGTFSGSKSALLAEIGKPSNWFGEDANVALVDLTPGGTNFAGTNPIFTVGTPASITGQPSNSAICPNATTSFSITASNATGYQWQVNSGSGFTNLSNVAPYTGVTTNKLTITGAAITLNGYLYRCVATGAPNATSNSATLTVKSTTASTMSKTACNSFVFNGLARTTSGIYKDTLVNKAGCDSVITMNLTINKSTSSTMSKTACNSFVFNGITRTASGVFKDTLVNKAGCDSIITLNLTINKSTSSTMSKTACNSYFFNGFARTVSGIYQDTLVNKAGCDSIIYLNLTINKSTSSTMSKTACNSFVFNGITRTASGVFKDTLVNKAGCDSVITMNLTINKSTASTMSKTACDSYFFNGITRTISGVYQDTLVNKAGCDSVIYLNLTINKVDTTVTLSNKTLTAKLAGAAYQWINCNNPSVNIPSATNQSYTPTATGNYAVIVTANGCKDTSSCHKVTIIITGNEDDLDADNTFAVYPNPARETVHVSVPSSSNAKVSLVDMTGHEVYSQTITGTQIDISTSGFAEGVYLLKVSGDNFNKSKNIVIIK